MAGGSGGPMLARSPASQRSGIEEVLARTMPDVLALLTDGVARSKREIVAALVDRHPRDDIKHAIMRLAVTGQLIQVGNTYALAADGGE